MNELFATAPDAASEHIAPHLEAALGALSEADRDALMFRYFERTSGGDHGAFERAGRPRIQEATRACESGVVLRLPSQS
jgi:hypothetical protein